jgi:hypothetical protein
LNVAGELIVDVTAELIAAATVRDSRRCMIAEAIKEQNPHLRSILVDLQTIRWTNPRTRKRYICLTPETAGMALVNFDQGREIEPFVFRVVAAQVVPIAERVAKTEAEQLSMEGAVAYRVKQQRGRKRLKVRPNGDATIEGGVPLLAGHLKGTSGSRQQTGKLMEPRSNVSVSRNVARFLGRRRLRG